MSILKVVTVPDSVLSSVASVVDVVDDSIRKLMDDMLETMYQDKGIGLAAPQIGLSKRIIVIDLQDDDDLERPKGFYPLYAVNPEIMDTSKEMVIADEGCLSIPEQRVAVKRHSRITVKFLDYRGTERNCVAEGWLARVFQHEIDHLNGITLVDYLSKLKKDVVVRKVKKLQKHID